MGKVRMPIEAHFIKKIGMALLILLGMVVIAQVALTFLGFDPNIAFPKAIKIVTHVDVATEQIGMKYLFVILSILGDVVQFYLIYVLLEYLLEGKFTDIFSGVRNMNKAKSMREHFIVAGGGRVGLHAAHALKEYTNSILVVDSDEETIKKMRKEGFTAVKGDVLDESFLKELEIEKAKTLIACLGEDSENLLLILTAKELNPGLRITARANSDSVVQKMKHAGAHHVVVPSSLGGEELAKSAARIS